MAYLIPENLRTRRDVAPGVNRMARVLQEALDDDATVWYEPLFDGSGKRPDLVVLVPDSGVLILEVLEEKASAIRSIDEGVVLIDRRGSELRAEEPLRSAEEFAAGLSSRIAAEARLSPVERLPVGAAGVFAYLARDDAEG